jgi:hypothetical protein
MGSQRRRHVFGRLGRRPPHVRVLTILLVTGRSGLGQIMLLCVQACGGGHGRCSNARCWKGIISADGGSGCTSTSGWIVARPPPRLFTPPAFLGKFIARTMPITMSELLIRHIFMYPWSSYGLRAWNSWSSEMAHLKLDTISSFICYVDCLKMHMVSHPVLFLFKTYLSLNLFHLLLIATLKQTYGLSIARGEIILT